MECPECRKRIDDNDLFCTGCGTRLPKIIKEQINQEIKAALNELQEPELKCNLVTPPQKPAVESSVKKNETGDLSYETDDVRKIEYKRFLKEILSDGHISADEFITLAQKIKELGLSRDEALNIQADVARELGFDISEQGDLLAGLFLEINTNKSYFVEEMDNLEFRLTNTSNDQFDTVTITSYLINQKTKEERFAGTLKPNNKIQKTLPFLHNRRGNESIEICLSFFDSQRNPSVYKAEFQVRVLTREEERAGVKSITISFAADKIMGNDFSNMAEIFEKEKKLLPDKRSSYEESERKWKRLPLIFDEDETNKRRNEVIINKKMKEGEENFSKGTMIKNDAEKMAKPAALDTFKAAFTLLSESKECYKKVREIDPEHSFSFERVREIRQLISEIENKIGILEKEPEAPPIKLSSGCLIIKNLQKKIYIYSKDKVTLGRGMKNDIVLRLMPYEPKEKYLENWQKSSEISSIHAEIMNKNGLFYIRDTGSDNTGSTNGTYLDGKRLKPLEDRPLKDDMRINIAKVLDLECQFLGEFRNKEKEADTLSSCYTVLGEISDSCFGIDKKGIVDAIKFGRRNNYTDEEKYIILIREITIGKSRSNGISLDSDKVSDIHAKIFYRNDQYWIEDLNSRHGTYVNSNPIYPGNEISLGEQAEIVIGDVTMNFQGLA